MYEITPQLYEETADRLCDAIGTKNYFSGSIEFGFGDVECRLTVSVIVHRRQTVMPEGTYDTISDLIPVWWEFHTSDEGEMLNDFSFTLLKEYIC